LAIPSGGFRGATLHEGCVFERPQTLSAPVPLFDPICYTSDWAFSMWPVAKLVLALGLLSLAGSTPGLCVDLSIPAQVAGPGASVLLPISFASHGDSVSGLQFDLLFNDSVLSLSAVVGDAARSSEKTLYFASLGSGRTRVLITELNQNTISDGSIANLFVNVRPGVAPGSYSIHFGSAVASDPSGYPVAVTTADGAIAVQQIDGAAVVPEGVLNGASLLPGPVAPGEIITIMGSAIAPPAAPESARVTFDSLAAPLLYMASEQINAVVPFGVAGRSSTIMEIANLSGSSTRISIPVASSAPAIFTLTGSGTGRGAILNQDGTVNSPDNPAQSGSIIVLFATGAGQTTPPGTDGLIPTTVLPKPHLPVSVQIGGATAEILYAGAAPGLISGALQVNCRLPQEVKAGRSVPVLLNVGEATSPPVTIAVK